MALGLFGKLPAKRDFVAQNAPRRFLDLFEPWLQKSIAASRHTMGDTWQNAFVQGPIWRFWIAADLAGTSALGAIMPSVDAVGRYFPLTVFAIEDPTAPIPPPEIDANDAWFDAVETVLLDALQPEATYELVLAGLASLGPPHSPEPFSPSGVEPLADGAVLVRDFDDALPTALKAARRFNYRSGFLGQTFWWTIGGEGYPPSAIVTAGMPSPSLFADMLTGSFSSLPAPA